MNLMQNLSIKYKLIIIMLMVTLCALVIPFTIVIFNDLKTFRDDMMSNGVDSGRGAAEDECDTDFNSGYRVRQSR
jgi:hypothetical protein